MTQHPSARHPTLDHLLAALDIGVANFTLCDVRDGWTVRFDACKTASLHYCMAGSGELVVQNGERIALNSNSFVMLPLVSPTV
ncbi:cupin domain-containing protein [Burkholderia sp. Bp9143]|uniref:cupin domain-containing protein n=1 Tax=Burkholderia sp. Bp9143 TaxID=2184574 RepID=UPI0021AB13F6|nr:cupin domain-containing protein [Burkholderia sp. Bp9143]